MKHKLTLMVVLTALPWLAGFGGGDLEKYPDGRINPSIIEDVVSRGATSCRYNLEDLLNHAMGNRDWDGVAFYPVGDEKRRPATGIYVTTYPDGSQSHLQWVAGPDASGMCALYWTESRFWKEPCDSVAETYIRERHLTPMPMGSEKLLIPAEGEPSSLKVVTTSVADGSLVTESDIAWRVDPDEKAREWIKEDHGYDPGP